MLPVLCLSSIFIFLEDFDLFYTIKLEQIKFKKFKIYKLRSMRVNSEKDRPYGQQLMIRGLVRLEK